MEVNMTNRLDLLEKRYHEIEELLMQPDILQDIKKTRELQIELSNIEDAVNVYQEYKKILSDLEEAHLMTKDKELAEFAMEEIERLNTEKACSYGNSWSSWWR